MPAPAESARSAPLPADLRTPALVLTDAPALLAAEPAEGVTLCALGTPPPRDGGWASVTLALADETALRRAVSALPSLGRARSLAVVLRSAVRPVPLLPRPEWPPLRELDVRMVDGGAVTRVELTRGVPAADVLVELARATGPGVVTGNGGLVAEPGLDLGVPVDGTVVTDDVPASLALTPPTEPSTILAVEPVPPQTGADLDVGPLDEAVLNPRGSATAATRGAVDLDPSWEPTAALVASLRDVEAVRLAWPAPERLVAALALAGVPLLATGPVPPAARARLGDALADLLEPRAGRPVDRSVRSVLLSRAAQDTHAVPAWRERVASRAGLRVATPPTVSVVLTCRADLLDHARTQLARQVGVEVEVLEPGATPTGDVVLTTAADGWWGPEVLRDLLRARRFSGADVVEMPAEVVHAEAIGTTVQRRVVTQQHVARPDRLAGAEGLVLVDRALVGVDPEAAGATTYRTHGLAHVARLRGHAGVGDLLRREHVVAQWRGLHLGPLVKEAS